MNRNKITKEDAIEILKAKPINRNQNKLSEFLKQDNVKAFHRILINKSFENGGFIKNYAIPDEEICIKECQEYFQLCLDYDIIPCIATLAQYLRIDVDVIYSNIKNPESPMNAPLKNAIKVCHAYQEEATLHGNVNPVLYMFLAKNYYGLQDTNTLNLTSQLTDNTINTSNTMKVIQEQLLLENKETDKK